MAVLSHFENLYLKKRTLHLISLPFFVAHSYLACMGTKNIFLALKESIISADLHGLLETEGYFVKELEPYLDPFVGLFKTEKTVDLIITNPWFTGVADHQPANQIFCFTKKSRVLFITGMRDVDLPYFEKNSFHYEVLFKPFTKVQLLKAIQKMDA